MADYPSDTCLKPTQVLATIEVRPTKPKKNKRRAKRPFDKRYLPGRKVKAFEAMFRERLGAAASDPVTSAAISRAAELAALAEVARARALMADPGVSLDDVVRLSRAADMAVLGCTSTAATSRTTGRRLAITSKWCHHERAVDARRVDA